MGGKIKNKDNLDKERAMLEQIDIVTMWNDFYNNVMKSRGVTIGSIQYVEMEKVFYAAIGLFMKRTAILLNTDTMTGELLCEYFIKITRQAHKFFNELEMENSTDEKTRNSFKRTTTKDRSQKSH